MSTPEAPDPAVVERSSPTVLQRGSSAASRSSNNSNTSSSSSAPDSYLPTPNAPSSHASCEFPTLGNITSKLSSRAPSISKRSRPPPPSPATTRPASPQASINSVWKVEFRTLSKLVRWAKPRFTKEREPESDESKLTRVKSQSKASHQLTWPRGNGGGVFLPPGAHRNRDGARVASGGTTPDEFGSCTSSSAEFGNSPSIAFARLPDASSPSSSQECLTIQPSASRSSRPHPQPLRTGPSMLSRHNSASSSFDSPSVTFSPVVDSPLSSTEDFVICSASSSPPRRTLSAIAHRTVYSDAGHNSTTPCIPRSTPFLGRSISLRRDRSAPDLSQNQATTSGVVPPVPPLPASYSATNVTIQPNVRRKLTKRRKLSAAVALPSPLGVIPSGGPTTPNEPPTLPMPDSTSPLSKSVFFPDGPTALPPLPPFPSLPPAPLLSRRFSHRRWTVGNHFTDDDKVLRAELDELRRMGEEEEGDIADDEWGKAEKALLACRELIQTEQMYLEILTRLYESETAMVVPSQFVIMLPALIAASQEFLARLKIDPSIRGVTNAFFQVEEQLEKVFVDWSSIAGDVMTAVRDSASSSGSSSRRSRPSRTPRSSISAALAMTPMGSSDNANGAPTRTSSSGSIGPGSSSGSRTPGSESDGGGPSVMRRSSWRAAMAALPLTRSFDGNNLPSVPESQATRNSTNNNIERLDVNAILIKPTQRSSQYHILFKRLLEHLPKTSASRPLVEKAFETARRIADHCNDAQRNNSYLREPPTPTTAA